MLNISNYFIFLLPALLCAAISAYHVREKNKHIRFLQNKLSVQQIEMRETLDVAMAASTAKNDFLANTSHEIRTPMNAILGMTRLLLDSPLSEEQQSWASLVYDSGENLLAIINDILDLSKIEAGKLTLNAEPFDLCRALADTTDLVTQRAEQKGLALFVDIGTNVPRMVSGDVLRLKQVVLNLMNNAVKFTSQGHVKLTVRKDAHPQNHEHLLFSIEDTGIGIAPDKLGHIFDQFTQAEKSTERRYGGTGLGLTITKKLVQMMCGEIGVESKLGHGSKLWFSALMPEARKTSIRAPVATLLGKRILIFADNPISSTIAANYIESLGMQIEICNSAADILNHLQTAEQRGALFDFILIKKNLSNTRIFELIQRIRIFPSFQNIRFLAVSTLGSLAATRLINSPDISGLLTYPLFPDNLEDTLRIILQNEKNGVKGGIVTRHTIENMKEEKSKCQIKDKFHGAQILVVEDMEVNQILMKNILEKFGCKTDAAISGVEAVIKLRNKRYDLVFMDGHMPEMDGFEATRHIRHMESHNEKQSIVVALTADAMNGDAEKYLQAGMNDYLNKPVTPEQIGTMLRKWLVSA